MSKSDPDFWRDGDPTGEGAPDSEASDDYAEKYLRKPRKRAVIVEDGSDLVAEMRRVAEWLRGWDPDEGKLHDRAADHIKALEAKVERLREALDSLHTVACRIWDTIVAQGELDYDEVLDWLAKPSDVARAALEEA